MISPYNNETKHIYYERSPLHFADQISCGIVFFQGEDDKVGNFCNRKHNPKSIQMKDHENTVLYCFGCLSNIEGGCSG